MASNNKEIETLKQIISEIESKSDKNDIAEKILESAKYKLKALENNQNILK